MADIPIPDEEARRIADEANRAARAAAIEQRRLAEAAAASAAAAQEAKFALGQAGQGLIQFSRSLVDSNAGMGKYGQAIKNTTDGLGDVAIAMGGPLGIAIGLFVKVLGSLTNSVLQANDTIISGYDKLADMGAAAEFNTQELMDLADAHKFPVTGGYFKKLVEVVTEFGSNVTGLGSTAGEGITKFVEILDVGQDVRNEFNKLGVTNQKLAQLQAGYLANEIKMGNARKKTNDELQKDSLKYVTNLVELSALTGESIDNIKKKQEEDLKDIGYNLALQERAGKENGELIKSRIQRGVELAGQVDETSRKAVMEVISKGSAIGPQAAALEQRFGQAGLSFVGSVQDLEAGRITEDEFRKRLQDSIVATNKKVGKQMQLGGSEVQNNFGYTAKTLEYLSKVLGEKTTETVEGQVKDAKTRKDDIKDTQNAIQDATRTLSRAFDEFLKLIQGPVNAAFRGIMYAFKALSQGLLKFLTRFKQFFGFDEKSIDPKLPYMFDTLEDLLEEQKRVNAEVLKIEKYNAEKGYKPGEVDLRRLVDPKAWLQDPKLWDYYKSQQGINAQIKQLLGTDAYKKQLDEREKLVDREKVKGDAKEQAKQEKANAKEQSSQAPSTEPAVSVRRFEDINQPTTVNINNEQEGQKNREEPKQKFMRGGIAQDPNAAKNVLSGINGNAMIPLPSGISIPADVSLSEDFIQKLNLGKDKKDSGMDAFSVLQETIKSLKVDTLPADFSMSASDILKDSEKFDSIMSGYTDTLKTNLDSTFQFPETTDRKSTNSTNEILSILVDKMDLLANKMKENADMQYDTLMRSRR